VLYGDLHAKMVELNESMNHPFRSAKCKEERIDGKCREGLGGCIPGQNSAMALTGQREDNVGEL
jgi:hypothetical protein